jgi:hypothetical protein
MKTLLGILLAVATALTMVASSLATFTSTSVNGEAIVSAVDWTPPTVTFQAPVGPWRGNVQLEASAVDADSSIATLGVELRAAGTEGWASVCTLSPPVTACQLTTGSHPDGAYELRATAVDVHGNTGVSVTRTRVLDNTAPAVTLSDPGSFLRGTVTLQANASDATTGVAEVRFSIARAGSGAFTQVCVDTTSPYTCDLDTTTLADGLYDLRAVAVDAAGNQRTNTITDRHVDNTPLAVILTDLPDAVRGTVMLDAQVSSSGTGPVTVTFQRRAADTTSWTTICSAVAGPPFRCSWNTDPLAQGDWELRAVATGSGTTATSTLVDITIDRTAPTVTVQDPGSPLSGMVDVRATAADVHSDVASVRIQIAPSGTSSWSDVCVDATAPYSCRLDTVMHPDGLYQFRAIATDLAGNIATSTAVTNRRIDNTVSSVSLTDPGEYLRDTVDLEATANSTAGVTSVRIEQRPAGTTTWHEVCTDTVSPYGCAWDTHTVADGAYDLRAVLTDGSGKVTESAVVAARNVNNSPLRGVDVQAFNGGTLGRIDAGDRLVLTYNERIDTGSVLAGWDGQTRAVTVRARDGLVMGATASDDVLDVLVGSTPVNLGSVRLGANYVEKNRTVTFQATMAEEVVEVDGRPASTVVVRLGTMNNTNTKDLRNVKTTATMVWTPSAFARDLTGFAASNSPVTESGPADRDF